MLYRRFGRTELPMPVFSCGGMRYQHSWQDLPLAEVPPASQENLEATLHRALELGITHIETARGYGSSEIQLGQILPKLPREKLIVQTKVAPTRRSQDFRREFERSLANLKLESVDLFSIHGINDAQLLRQTLGWNGCLQVAKQLQREGKIRFIGLSTHAPLEVMLKAIASDQFDYINLHWYYINQTNWQAITAAQERDMGIFIISPSDKGGKLYSPPQRLIDLCAPLSPMVFNDLFCLSRPQIHTLSIGAARPEDFDEHLTTLDWLDRAAEILPPIEARLEQAAIERLGADWYHTWQIGLPTYDQTPGKLNIPVILWLHNLAIAYDLVEYGKMRYNLLGQGGSWFPGTNAAAFDPAKIRPLLKHSPHAAEIVDRLRATHELLGGATVQRLSQD